MANTKPPVLTARLGMRIEPELFILIESIKESPHESASSVVRRLVREAAARKAPQSRKGGARG